MMEQGRYASVADLCAFHGISRQTYYNWQSRFGNKAVLALRVDALEAEVRRLKEQFDALSRPVHAEKR